MVESTRPSGGYECVDPAQGERLWELDDPQLSSDERERLENHVRICDACRLRRALEREVPAVLREERAAPRRGGGLVVSGGLVLVVAGLALALVLPPAPQGPQVRLRDQGESSGFIRPVEGELVADRTPRISWRRLPGARAYRLRVEEVGGAFRWEGRTEGSSLEVAEPLPSGRGYRAILRPIPEDLVFPGDLAVAFRTGGRLAWLRYRLVTAPRATSLLPFVGLLLVAAGLVRSRFGLRAPQSSRSS